MNDNPLKQYFRRPAIYFKLPSEGRYYPTGVVDIPPNEELAVYPMTSIDEITVRTPDALFNGAAVVDVIKSCIPAIKDPWQLNNIDLEAVIVAIRAASVDGEIEISSECPSCKESGTYGVNLLKLLSDKIEIDYTTPLIIGDLTIKFRPLTFAETNKNNTKQFHIQRTMASLDEYDDNESKQKMVNESLDQLNELLLDIITQTVESITTPETTVTDGSFIRDFLANCDAKTSRTIKDYSTEMKQKNDTKPLKMTCVNCQHQYDQALVLNFTDFFV